MQHSVLAITLMLVSASFNGAGMVLQKSAVAGMPALERHSVWSSVRRIFSAPRWVLGWLMTMVAIIMNMAAVGLADISLVQPFVAFGLVVVALFSFWLLKEPLPPRRIVGMALCGVGIILLGALAQPSRVFASVAELLACYTHPGAIVWVGGVLGAVALITIIALRLAPPSAPTASASVAAPVGASAGRLWAGVLISFAAACLSITGLTFAKGLFGTLAMVGPAAALAIPWIYLLLALVLTFSTLALAWQQLSFQKGLAVVVLPVFKVASVALPLLVGPLVFSETFRAMSLPPIVLMMVGVVLLGERE